MAKKRSWTDFGHKLEEDSKGNLKLFYKVLKSLRKGNKYEDLYIKDEKGEIITEDAKIMERWKTYFQNLLHGRDIDEEQKREQSIIIGNEVDDDDNDLITKEEVIAAIKWLKNGKAPGYDRITSEMLKHMGEKGLELFTEVCNLAWKIGKIPSDWEVALLLPIFKSGDSKQCTNYRGITLLCTPMKVYEKILDNRLRPNIESQLHDAQSGFRKGRSIQDHVFTIQQIIDKSVRQNTDALFAFVDLEKAFDKVPRQKIWESLKRRKIGERLINAIKSLYLHNVNYVIRKNLISEAFVTTEGVRQGGGLSPLLFNIFMDDIINKCSIDSKKLLVGYKNLQRVTISEGAYADDVVVIAETQQDLKKNLETWNKTLKQYGMTMNIEKTAIMAVKSQEVNIQIDGMTIKQGNTFKYLGIHLENTGSQDIEIKTRIKKALNTYHAMNKSFISKREISRKTKLNVYNAIYRPILTFGCETWVLTERQKSMIQAAEMKYLRQVRGVTKMDKLRNEQIRQDLEMPSIMEYIEQKQLSWWGHLQRMEETRPVKRVWEAKMQRNRKRGRPKKTWDKVIGEILERRGTTWGEAKRRARNKKEWTKFVHD